MLRNILRVYNLLHEYSILDEVDREFKKIKRKNKQLFRQIEKQIILFQDNPRHPSLRLHKLSGDLEGIWSISISKNIMTYIQQENIAYFIDIGTHSEIYGK